MRERKGRLRATINRWASQDHHEAQDLLRSSENAGLVAIADASIRERVVLQGTLKSVTLRPRGGVPALEAELYDGSGTVLLLWLGRRRIGGVNPGVTMRVTGRLGDQHGMPVMYNPRYEIRP
ncbi:MAG TPA: OB-fold nucleic acid binding domain-containing protein [Marmoricola sp.]|nr:OB-fold nucleic acid binding domain-containing protein [Marmoricola sp.]HNI71260.1 OB-fold nucleic acid binding domain-containing protein [Marmoricola sp.]HNJ79278.1 OB-fold nucleic acid binding domain-containing protein [Marmoricola sp.]HNO39962.1 OB-fold nucleic acid binding domain-containing protein [Marmoricola sp.]